MKRAFSDSKLLLRGKSSLFLLAHTHTIHQYLTRKLSLILPNDLILARVRPLSTVMGGVIIGDRTWITNGKNSPVPVFVSQKRWIIYAAVCMCLRADYAPPHRVILRYYSPRRCIFHPDPRARRFSVFCRQKSEYIQNGEDGEQNAQKKRDTSNTFFSLSSFLSTNIF